jgi:hypothetical protein
LRNQIFCRPPEYSTTSVIPRSCVLQELLKLLFQFPRFPRHRVFNRVSQLHGYLVDQFVAVTEAQHPVFMQPARNAGLSNSSIISVIRACFSISIRLQKSQSDGLGILGTQSGSRIDSRNAEAADSAGAELAMTQA